MALNYNVKLALLFTFASTAARQIWAFVTLSLYLKSLTGTNFSVGLSEGIQGGLQALTAIVVGWYVDRARRDTGMKVAGSIGLVAIAVTLFTLSVSDNTIDSLFMVHSADATATDRFIFMTAALSFWGMYQGVWNTVLETIYADSITTGNRSDFNTRKFMLLQAASIVGPVIALCLFLYEGDTWYHMTLRLVFIVGVCLCAPGAVMLFFFDDDKALGDESEAVSVAPSRDDTATPRSVSGGSSHAAGLSPPLSEDGSGSLDVETGPSNGASINFVRSRSGVAASNGADNSGGGGIGNLTDRTDQVLTEVLNSVQALSAEAPPRKRLWGCITASKIPHILVFSDLISGLASGMTIKFFPLFFARKVWLSPVAVQGIYVALPVFMIGVSFVGQRTSKLLGRVITSVLMAYIGSGALIGLWAVLTYRTDWECFECPWHHATNKTTCEAALSGPGQPYCKFRVTGHDSWTCKPVDCGLSDHWYYVLALYFLSTFQHCCRPLKKSILMDYTRKSTRGRWNSLDSVTRFGWSGSAVLGGYIIDRWDYGASFLATALAQFLSASILLVLLPLLGVDKERGRMSFLVKPIPDPNEARSRRRKLDAAGGEREPLLGDGADSRPSHSSLERIAAVRASSMVTFNQ